MHPIFNAIETDSFKEFVSLIETNPEYLLQQDEDGWNLLSLSVHYDMFPYTEFLLQKLSPEQILSSKPLHPLLVALENKNFNIVNKLLKNPNIDVDTVYKNNETMLFYANNLNNKDMLDILLERKANIFIKNKQNVNVITKSIEYNNYDFFIKFTDSPIFNDNYEESWILTSVKNGNKKIFDYLLPYYKGDIDVLFNNAVHFEKVEIMASILNTGDFIPGKKQITDIVEIMCKKYPTIEEQNASLELAEFLFEIKTPFQNFVNSSNQSVWMLAIENNNEVIFNKLINENVSYVNQMDKDNHTPLMYAVEKNKINFVSKLLEKKANPNLVDYNNDTALIKAVRKGYANIVEEILKYPVKINEINKNKETALNLAVYLKNMDIVTQLIWAGGEIMSNPLKFLQNNDYYQLNYNGHCEKIPLPVEEKEINNFIALVQLGFNLYRENDDKDTLLLNFIKKGYLSNFHALLQCNIDFNQNDKDNNSPLMCCMNKQIDDYSLSLMRRVQNIDLSVINNQNENVYDLCIKSGKPKHLEALLNYDKNLSPDNALKSLLFLTKNGNLNTVWDILNKKLPNIEKIIDKDNNTLLMLATLGNQFENFKFLINQRNVNFSSKTQNTKNQSLVDLINDLDEISASNFIDIFSKHIAIKTKKNKINKNNLNEIK